MGRSISVAGAAALAILVAGAAHAVTKQGGPGPDRLRGTKAADKLVGKRGPDLLIGGRGADILVGGKGRDILRGGPGRDGFNMKQGVELKAPGRDRIKARDGNSDEINCGAGNDVAIVDEVEDGVYGCEKVREPPA